MLLVSIPTSQWVNETKTLLLSALISSIQHTLGIYSVGLGLLQHPRVWWLPSFPFSQSVHSPEGAYQEDSNLGHKILQAKGASVLESSWLMK